MQADGAQRPTPAAGRTAVAGVDGCRGGWVVATFAGGDDHPSVRVEPAIATVIDALHAGELAAVGIDMPIGLTANGERSADTAARELLGPRRSSLFPTPPRAVLDATDYADALARCRAASGKGLSRQAFNLVPRMRELAAALDPHLDLACHEVHPETSFAVLRGAPCAWPKRTAGGRAERIAALAAAWPEVGITALAERPPRGAAPDDVLDALVAAWTARRIANGTALVLGDPDPRDPAGHRITILA